MTSTVLDARELRLDVRVRRGNAVAISFEWPSTLAGRTFTAKADTTALTVTRQGTTLTVELPASITATDRLVAWSLTETTGAINTVIVSGLLLPSVNGTRAPVLDRALEIAGDAVEVTIGPPTVEAVSAAIYGGGAGTVFGVDVLAIEGGDASSVFTASDPAVTGGDASTLFEGDA